MTRTSVGLDVPAVTQQNWSRLDQERVSFYGHFVIWDVPPSTDANIDLDATANRLSLTKQYTFRLRVDCSRVHPCVEDGDSIETVISTRSAFNASHALSEVRVVTHVRSLLSCRNTRVLVEPNEAIVALSGAIRVRLLAYDADSLPIRFTRADLTFLFGNETIAMQWSRGSNEYAAEVPEKLTGQPGTYTLVVRASNSWSEALGHATSCELLRRTIVVEEGFNTHAILGGAGGAAVVVVGAIVLVVRKRHAHLQAIMVMLFTEVSPLSDKPDARCRLGLCS
jgi:hypothetical protein